MPVLFMIFAMNIVFIL